MSEITKCPKCGSEYVYFDGSLYVCPECAHEFSADDHAAANEGPEVARDSNGAELFDGDAVTVIKDLKVKVIKHMTEEEFAKHKEHKHNHTCTDCNGHDHNHGHSHAGHKH